MYLDTTETIRLPEIKPAKDLVEAPKPPTLKICDVCETVSDLSQHCRNPKCGVLHFEF